jgi:hypothetical protein
MHTKIVLFIAFAIALAPWHTSNASAEEAGEADLASFSEMYNFELRGFYWNSGLDATVRADDGDFSGTDIDIVEDLGIDKTKGLFGAEATLELYSGHKLKLTVVKISYDTAKNIDKEITFKGDTYPVNTKVNSKLDLLSARLGYEYDFFRRDEGFLGIQVAANILRTKASLVTNDTLANSAEVATVIPMVIATGRAHFNKHVSGTVELGWMGYGSSNLFDTVLYIDYNPVRNVGVTAGWKAIMIDAEDGGDKVDVTWSGIFAGLIIRI